MVKPCSDTFKRLTDAARAYRHVCFIIIPILPILAARYVFNKTVACTHIDLNFFSDMEPHILQLPVSIPPPMVLNTYMWGLAFVTMTSLAIVTAGLATKLVKVATNASFWSGPNSIRIKIGLVGVSALCVAYYATFHIGAPTNCIANGLFDGTVGRLPSEIHGIGSAASSINNISDWGFDVLAASIVIVLVVIARLVKDDCNSDDAEIIRRLDFVKQITAAMTFTLIASYIVAHLYFSLGNAVLDAGRDQACKAPVVSSTPQNLIVQFTPGTGTGTGPTTVTAQPEGSINKSENKICNQQNAIIARYEVLRQSAELYWAVITSIALASLYFPAATTIWFRLQVHQSDGGNPMRDGNASPVRTFLAHLMLVLSPLLVDAVFGISTSAVQALKAFAE